MAKPLTDEELEAMKQSVQDTQNLTGLTGAEQARLIMQDALPDAARSLVSLALFADKESVRMQSTIHILDRGLGRVQDNPPEPVDDPFNEIMAKCARVVQYPEEGDASLIEPMVPTPIQPGELIDGRSEKAIDEELLLDEMMTKLRAVDNEWAPPDIANEPDTSPNLELGFNDPTGGD